jgi:DNA-binding NtrC family response regulator
LVDDDREYLTHLKTLLLETVPGACVVCLDDPDEALRFLSVNKFDLVISDVEFGCDKDGFWLLSGVVEQAYRAPMILHSGSINPNYELIAMKEGAFEYVSKPMTAQRLREIVSRLKNQGEERVICCVDDEPDVVRGYMDGISDAKVMYFASPDAILDAAQSDAAFWSNVEIVLSDYYFGFANASEMKLVRSLRRSGFNGPVVLFSNIAGGGDVGAEFDGRIDKVKVPSIKWLLEKTARPA